jgi:hypothetical protein
MVEEVVSGLRNRPDSELNGCNVLLDDDDVVVDNDFLDDNVLGNMVVGFFPMTTF